MSTSLAERLRGIVRPAGAAVGAAAAAPQRPDAGECQVADAFDGRWAEARGGRYVVVDRTFGPGHRHGRIAIMDAMPPWPRLPLLERQRFDAASGRLLFIDVETTGLAGGAGTYAFLVGCGWFDGPLFRVRQLLLSSFAAEAALLDGLAELASGIAAIVTFNGKSFDLPLIETRFLFHRMPTPFAGIPHVDLLHPARRLWRPTGEEAAGAIAGCRLSALEEGLCGLAREGDVPGFEIPTRYFTFVRTGDARPLAAVLEHNRLDLVSLALLTARASRLLEEGPAAATTAREALGAARLYEGASLYELACEAYGRSLELPGDALTRAEALRCQASLLRRLRRFDEAATAWEALLGLHRCPPHFAREASEALAVHHEHRRRDPQAARRLALQSLRLSETAARQHAVRHRLARLDRKLDVEISRRLPSLFPLDSRPHT